MSELTTTVEVQLSEEERELLEVAASHLGMSVSEYVRENIIQEAGEEVSEMNVEEYVAAMLNSSDGDIALNCNDDGTLTPELEGGPNFGFSKKVALKEMGVEV